MDLHTDLRAPVYQVLPHPPKLPESLREALHVCHYSNRTEDIVKWTPAGGQKVAEFKLVT